MRTTGEGAKSDRREALLQRVRVDTATEGGSSLEDAHAARCGKPRQSIEIAVAIKVWIRARRLAPLSSFSLGGAL
jgi:hypothetical protein